MHIRSRLASTLLTLLAFGCATAPAPTPTTTAAPAAVQQTTAPATGLDPHSFSHPEEVAVRHLDLDLSVDFAQKRLSGSAALDVQTSPDATTLVLDTRDLEISGVTVDDHPAKFSLSAPVEFLGQALTIPITPATNRVVVTYRTSPNAAALQWLEPSQTAGGKLPFLFTQSESILARTWVPCQDTPTVRMTYDATIRVPQGFVPVMSAQGDRGDPAHGIHRFHMAQPIPSYLLALAVGDLAFRAFDERSGVWAEPSVVEKAAWEFADTPKMIAAAEKLYGPYQWERYDILVLPPSFPFGGMENPRLTFATPTVIAGDRSLVSLVAHELAHSWSGNLVTNATWNDFWLNEGFTTYFENRIMEALYGRDYSEMLTALGYEDLQTALKELGPTSKDTALKLDLKGRDPDEGAGDIAYQKGYFFLRMLEEKVGRQRFDQFLRQYFATFAFQSMTTEKFVDYLERNLIQGDSRLRQNVGEWIYQPGVPSNIPVPKSTRFEKVDEAAKKFVAGAAATSLETKEWSTHEWLRFLAELPDDISRERIAELDRTFHFTQSGNAQLLSSWFVKTVRAGYTESNSAMERFLTTVGRRYLVRGIYTELAKTPAGLEYARQIYAKARPGYHAVTRGTIDQLLGWKG